KDGTLYVATGDKGQIYSVTPDGKGQLFYGSDEAHIKVLGFNGQGTLLAGAEPNGRVLPIARGGGNTKKNGTRAAEGFVGYENGKREVTSLVTGADGSLYVSAIGEKAHAGVGAATTVITGPQGATTITNAAPISGQGGAPFLSLPPAISSSIYRIAADG